MISELFYRLRLRLIQLEKFLGALSLIILLTIALLQVILRNLFELGFSDMDVIARHLVLFVTFMGAALASEGNRHIKIDCISSAIKQTTREKLRRPLLSISSIICAIFFWYALQFWLDEYQYAPDNEQLSLYMALILPFGFLVLSLHFFLITISPDSYEIQASQVD